MSTTPPGSPPADPVPDGRARVTTASARTWLPSAAGGLVVLIAFGGYLSHLLPGVGFWDTAIFQAAPPVLGLTHPTGYPTYLLLGWAWTTVLPFGDPAFELNLLTAAVSAGAVGMVFALGRSIGAGVPAAAAAALTFGFGMNAWRTAIRADPHPLHVLLGLAVLVLLIEWRKRGGDRRFLVAAALLFGLALGNHALTALLAPAIGLFVLATRPSVLGRPRDVAMASGALLAGLLVYLYVPLRAAANPSIRYDYAPATWDLFWRYVLGRDFVGGMKFLSPDGPGQAAAEFGVFAGRVGEAYSLPIAAGLAWLALVGFLALAGRRDGAPIALLLGLGGGLTLYARLTYANGDIERYALLPLAVLAVLAALGAQAVATRVLPDRVPSARLTSALLVVPVALFALNTDQVRPSSAGCFVDAVVAEAPQDTLLVSWWSYSTPIWYAQAVDGARPDVEVVNAGGFQVVDVVGAHATDGRPIVLIQFEADLGAVRDSGYTLDEVRFCGVSAWSVALP